MPTLRKPSSTPKLRIKKVRGPFAAQDPSHFYNGHFFFSAALRELEKRKLIEKNIDEVFKFQRNIETQLHTLEKTIFVADVHSAMKQGAEAMKTELKKTNVDEIGELQDDLQEAYADYEEINEVMATPIGPTVDEDELADDLAALEGELEVCFSLFVRSCSISSRLDATTLAFPGGGIR